jgi:ribonucleoside-diphosphate reductase beta chain
MIDPDKIYASLRAQDLSEMQPIRVQDKMVFGSDVDINQLSPMKYPGAYQFFKDGMSNNWTPEEVSMTEDLVQWTTGQLTEVERHVFVTVLSYLTTSDILIARNIATALFDKLPVPEVQLFLGRQTFEEGLHQHTYQLCIENLGLDQGYIYNLYRTIPEIYQKIKLSQSYTNVLCMPEFDMSTVDSRKFLLEALIFYGLGFEGVWFYNGFTPVFALQRNGKMKGTGEQFQYIMRDETLHARFYSYLIREIIREYPELWDSDMHARAVKVFENIVRSEEIYIGYVLRDPILAYDAEQHMGQTRFMANLRARSIGLPDIFPGQENSTPWLEEQALLKKEKNFFETRVTEYQSAASLNWD